VPPPAGNGAVLVRLGAGFSPPYVRLRVGQQFLVSVIPGVQVNGIPWQGGCSAGAAGPVSGGLLTVHCLAMDRYLYTARRPGITTVTATVQPRCAPGSVCPMWISAARLTVVIS